MTTCYIVGSSHCQKSLSEPVVILAASAERCCPMTNAHTCFAAMHSNKTPEQQLMVISLIVCVTTAGVIRRDFLGLWSDEVP